MSKHVFTIEVECDSAEDYENAIRCLTSVGEITDEESDFR